MTSPEGRRSASEIRDYFIERLNEALLRPGMFGGGGEMTQLLVLADLAWIDRRDSELGSLTGMLSWAGAWSNTGVHGRFLRMFGGIPADHDSAAALVYAGVARTWGYLVPLRELSAGDYVRLRRDAREWTACADRTVADVIAEFGTPSLWRPEYNPRFPTSVAYVSGRLSDPLVAFDFWQDAQWGSNPRPSRFGAEPVLRNVRWLDGQFKDGFTYTPVGSTLLIPDDPEE